MRYLLFSPVYWEDTPNINTYNYRLNGFKEQPTDHYARPFYQLVNYDSQPKLCIRSQPRHKVSHAFVST